MKILALEFSSARRGVAVTEAGQVLGSAEAEGLTPGPLALIEDALRAARVEREGMGRYDRALAQRRQRGRIVRDHRSATRILRLYDFFRHAVRERHAETIPSSGSLRINR